MVCYPTIRCNCAEPFLYTPIGWDAGDYVYMPMWSTVIAARAHLRRDSIMTRWEATRDEFLCRIPKGAALRARDLFPDAKEFYTIPRDLGTMAEVTQAGALLRLIEARDPYITWAIAHLDGRVLVQNVRG
jgi:hypothetical protein